VLDFNLKLINNTRTHTYLFIYINVKSYTNIVFFVQKTKKYEMVYMKAIIVCCRKYQNYSFFSHIKLGVRKDLEIEESSFFSSDKTSIFLKASNAAIQIVRIIDSHAK
jgi:hypothetical protein